MNKDLIEGGHIKEISSLLPIISKLKYADQNSLVIFDVDDVLIMPTSDHDFRHTYRAKKLETICKQLTNSQIEVLKSIIFAQREIMLVDPGFNQLFDILRSKKIPNIALTALGTGKFGIISNLVELRINELNKFNLSFKLRPLNSKCIISDLKNATKIFPDTPGVPCLDSGIIFTAGIDKGVVLEYVLHQYNYYPKSIIFVDDYLPNLESLNKLCNKLKINFHGFYYKAASLMPLPEINEKLEILRFQILSQEQLWLNYHEVHNTRLKSSNTYKYYDKRRNLII